MGKRSIVKRLLLAAGNIQKSSIRTGLKIEKAVKATANDIAGPEAIQRVASCNAEGECLCAKTREEMFKTHVAFLPRKIDRFKDEYAEFKEKVKRPGELTVEDVKAWPFVLVMAAFMFWFGKSVGRWNLVGFKYEDF